MDAVVQALGDAGRRHLLDVLRAGPATAGALAEQLPIARPGVSRHLRVLLDAGLVEVEARGRERVYALRPEALVDLDEWLEGYRALWRHRLDALHTEVAQGRPGPEEEPMTERMLATVRREGASGVVRVEDVYDTSAGDLWAAVTQPERLARWIAEVTGDLRPGGAFSIRFTSSWTGTGTVEVCDPPRRLVVRTEGDDGPGRIEAVLTPEGARTRLVVEDAGIPLQEVPLHGAGWQVHLEDLGAVLAGRAPSDWRTRWAALSPAYEAAGVGEPDA